MLTVDLMGGSLVDNGEERAGLNDLLAEASIKLQAAMISFEFDEAALTAEEDVALGRLFPRRGRPTLN